MAAANRIEGIGGGGRGPSSSGGRGNYTNDAVGKASKAASKVAPGKSLKDMTPAEKRKWNNKNAIAIEKLIKQQKTDKKSSPATLKEASKKQTGKMTATKRGFSKDKASRKEMKMQDVFYARAGKADLKAGERTGASNANVSKSQSPSKIKVPVKKVGKK